jgi:DNA polymerase III psi subunit
VREEFARLLNHYNLLAAGQERFLEREPPLIEPFACALLKARLDAEFKHPIDPRQVLIKLPESVEIKVVPNVPSEVRVPSVAQQTLTLVELALLNIDRQMTLRLRHATLLEGESGQPLNIAGLSIARLRRLIIELDAAGQYRQHVGRLFSIDANPTPARAVRAQLLAGPYAAAMRLQAFCDYQRGLLGSTGWALLNSALNARDADQLAQGPQAARLSVAA